MINAGAILVCALLKTVAGPEMTLAEKFDYTLNYFVVRFNVIIKLCLLIFSKYFSIIFLSII